ncbi:AMP-binding protein [Bacillus solitudinis]|uniref:AMP-binding protein n=1 Tax=Bacillus solitudinis TaxID=2014074 RepID=UPI000C235A2D|nr:AMP-binding protein [Bacillus solitudinis]
MMMIGETLKQHASLQGEKAAIRFKDVEITYEQFYHHIQRWKTKLHTILKVDRPKRVALYLHNEPLFLELFYAIISLGWTVVPLDYKWTTKEREHALSISNPNLVICHLKDIDRCQESAVTLTVLTVEELIQSKEVEKLSIQIDEEQPFYLGFTSGSNGRPKGFLRSHASWLESFKSCEDAFSYTKDDTIYAPGSYVHSLSLFAAIHALHIGSTLWVTDLFCANEAAELIQTGKINVMYVVPTMLEAIRRALPAYSKAKVNMILSSGAKLTEESIRELRDYFPTTKFYEFYGASELSYVSFIDYQQHSNKIGSVGKAFPGVEIVIKGLNGEKIQSNEVGEVYVKSKQVFSQYVDDEQKTKNVIQGDEATVSDIGYLDQDDFLYLIGRKGNLIITGGLNVFPEEIEQIVKQFPEIEEAALLGKNDNYWGEKLVLFVKWKGSQNLYNVIEACREYLSAYKCPKEVIELEVFPYTTSGKVNRERLQELLEEIHE